MSDPSLSPDTQGVDAFTKWYNTHQASMNSAQIAKYKPYMEQIQKLTGYNASTGSWDSSKWPTYDPVSWGGAPAQRYGQEQAGLDALLARIGAGPQPSDVNDANAMTAGIYGYSPASYTAIQQGMPDRLNASNVMGSAANIAMGLQESPFGQQQQQALQLAQRQAEAAVGKQLEAIFGARGGLAGFQAAYDMTSQLQSSFMQQQSQNNLALLDRSLSAVNSENQYYEKLISQGAIDSKDFIKFRWDALQTGYQDYMSAMDQTMQQWQQQEQIGSAQYNQQVKVIQDQLNAVTGALAQEMGIDDFTLKNAAAWYAFWSQLAIDYEESGNPLPGQPATTTKPPPVGSPPSGTNTGSGYNPSAPTGGTPTGGYGPNAGGNPSNPGTGGTAGGYQGGGYTGYQ